MNGFIKIYRSLIDWEWYSDINTTRLFVHLLLTVNYEDTKFRGEVIKRGQRFCTVEELAAETSLTSRQVRYTIDKLILTKELAITSVWVGGVKGRIITVLNYDKYQSCDNTFVNNFVNNSESTLSEDCQQLVTNSDNNSDSYLLYQKEYKNNNNIIYTSCPEQISENCSELPEEAHEPQVTKSNLKIPLKDGSRYEITGDDISRYAQLYPKIDVEQELRSLIGWNEANPTRRKTKGGIRNHINTWLAKAQRAATDTRTSYSYASAQRPKDAPTTESKFSLSDFDEALQGAYTCQTSP